MRTAVLFDCEFLTAEGAQSRFWCGPFDPDPTVVQIGAVKLALQAPFDVVGTFSALIQPTDRHGKPVLLDPAFIALTGLSQAQVAQEGRGLGPVLADLAAFSGEAALWSWGKDELNLMAISAYVAGLSPSIPAVRFGIACALLIRAGVPYAEVQRLRSHLLCDHFGLPAPEGRPHDAAFDAMSLATVIRHLLATGRLAARDLDATAA